MIYDIKDSNCPKEIKDLFYQTLKNIQKSDFYLKDNYSDQMLRLDEMLMFNVVIDSDQILAFSGLQYGRWGKNVARVSSRLWYNPNIRIYFKERYSEGSPNLRYIMPEQIKTAKERYNLDLVFWSREKPYQSKVFNTLVENANKLCPYGFKHEPLDGLYNVCGNVDSKSCWQRICQIKFKDRNLNLPRITFEEWKEKWNY